MNRLLSTLLAMLALAFPVSASAQNFTLASIGPAIFGTIVSAPSGNSIFRATASTGAVTKLSGSAVRLSAGTVRSLVTVSCNNAPACNTANALVTITTSGTPTGRAAALQNFTVSTSGATATITTPPGTGNSISFRIGPIGRNSSKTFWVGYDLPIDGDNSAGSSGSAGSGLVVTVSRTNGNRPSSLASTIGATVFRGLSLSHSSDLNFGRISLPRSGTGTVSLAPATGAVTVTGLGVNALSAVSPSAATFALAGESGQSVSVSVPATFAMSGPGGAITVTTNPTLSGPQALSGALGAAGSLALNVGGSFNLPSTLSAGSYTGTFTVTVQYN